MPYLSQILIFPIKSLDGVSVQQATILASGGLMGDRAFAIVDQQGNVVNGKRTAAVHKLRSRFDLAAQTVCLQVEGTSEQACFKLTGDRCALASWLSDYFGFPVQVIHNPDGGFPDDTASPGPTVISTATLQAVADWFPDLSVEETRLRFRTNLELDNVEPFWEDQLFGEADSLVPFQIGAVQMAGVNPCQRCIVPVRDSLTGGAYPDFQKIFVTQRKATLPDGVARSRFNHFYRLAVNTRLLPSQAGKVLRIGDAVRLGEG